MTKLNKFLFMAVTVALLSGCGVAQQQAQFCGGDFEQACTTIFGFPEDKSADEDQDKAIDALEQQVNNLNSTININIMQINSLYSAISVLQSTNNNQDTQISALSTVLNNLQTTVNVHTTQIAALQTRESIVDFLDCGGDQSGFDEIVMRTSSGRMIAYFEQNGNRFLTILVPGNYRTTDQSSCPFTINNSMRFCDVYGCR
jgi:septal ring factor EnvC (AmiA/AmiB activator)